jgi:hypothetical protein
VKTLILFSTRDGQTREIASFLASELKELGIDADTTKRFHGSARRGWKRELKFSRALLLFAPESGSKDPTFWRE